MNYKKIIRKFPKLNTSIFNEGATLKRFEYGLIYTLYYEKSNLIEIGFAENNEILNSKIRRNGLTLLDKKRGSKNELHLLINILNEFGIKYSENLNIKYSNTLMRHLSTLGWPVGRSLFKQRKIKKELLYA